MTFTFTNYAAIKPRPFPLSDIVGKVLGGYNDITKAKYLKPTMEADIFHKQISPLAMLASNPNFSQLYPEQQHQILGYISQMISKQGIPQGMGGQGMQQGGGESTGMQSQGGMGGMGYPGQASQMDNQQGNQNGEGNDSLVPANPGEHFTGKFSQTPYTGGTAHRGSQGDTIYAPTGSNVQKGIDVITEAKGLKSMFNEYAKLAPKVGGAGGFKRDFSNIASGLAKTGLPFSNKIAEKLGGSTLSDQAASAESYKAQMAPALRAIGFSNPEISSMLQFYPGETEKNITERLAKTWPIIERKIKTQQKNLKKGINVNQNVIGENENPRNIEEKIARDERERAQYESQSGQGDVDNAGEIMLVAPDGSHGFVPAAQALQLIQSGKFKEAK